MTAALIDVERARLAKRGTKKIVPNLCADAVHSPSLAIFEAGRVA